MWCREYSVVESSKLCLTAQYLNALCCTDSNLLNVSLVYSDQITEPYKIMGNTSALSNEAIESAERKSAVERLMNPRILRDLAVIISTCGSKDNAESNRIPRSEIVSTLCTPLPCSAYWKATDGDFFLWNVITLHFGRLIRSPFSSDQVQTASR